jgi:hypothetical protein
MSDGVINAGNFQILLLHAYLLDFVHSLSEIPSRKTAITQMKVWQSKDEAEPRIISRFAGYRIYLAQQMNSCKLQSKGQINRLIMRLTG